MTRNMPSFRRWKTALLCGLLSVSTVSSYAFLGFGDIVNDPATMAGMFSQTGAQIAQMVQTYYAMVEMRDRMGTVASYKNWKGLARQLLRKECNNLMQRVLGDIRKRGARVSAETPTNPVLASMISGRRKMQEMSDRVSRGTFLADKYSSSDWSIANQDRRQQLQHQAELRDQVAAKADSSQGGTAIALAGAAYNTRPPGAPASGAQSSSSSSSSSGSDTGGSGSGASTTTNQVTQGAGNTSEVLSGLMPAMNKPATTGATSVSAEALQGARESVRDGYQNSTYAANPHDTATGAPVTDTAAAKNCSAKAQAMLSEASQLMDMGILQEYDAASEYVDGQRENLEAAREALDMADGRGPEPFLQHMIAQNDTLIGMYSFTMRAERMKQESEQIRRDLEAKQTGLAQEYVPAATYQSAVKSVQSASRPE